MADTQEVHDMFRGTAELAKWVIRTAIFVELAVAGIAVNGVFSQDAVSPRWRPLVAFMLATATVCLREYATNIGKFAEKCRRTSLLAFASGIPIPTAQTSTLRSDAPMGTLQIARALPATSLVEYYEPSAGAGDARLRELYAHSSFFSWRLLRSAAYFYGVATAVVFFATLTVMYGLAATEDASASRAHILDAIFSVVLAIIALRLASATWSSAAGAVTGRKVADALVEAPLPAKQKLYDIVSNYDYDRVGTSAPPTFIYRLMRRRLRRDWDHRKRALTDPGR